MSATARTAAALRSNGGASADSAADSTRWRTVGLHVVAIAAFVGQR